MKAPKKVPTPTAKAPALRPKKAFPKAHRATMSGGNQKAFRRLNRQATPSDSQASANQWFGS